MASPGLLACLGPRPKAPQETEEQTKRRAEERELWERVGRETPCVGCGYCCHKRPCGLAISRMKPEEEHCPFPTYHDGRWWCGLIEQAATPEEREELMQALYIGVGCSSSLFNQDRKNIPTPEEWERRRRNGHG
jgi:hypothetical protein